MGKAFAGLSEATALSTREEDSPFRVGAYLALQRKLRGIDLDELEGMTHIPRRSLERLESGAFDGVPDGFVRGFVRTVSEAIGLDADETVSRMLDEPRDEGVRQRISTGRGVAAALVLGGALLVVALVPAVVREGSKPSDPSAATPPVAGTETQAAKAPASDSARRGDRSETANPVRWDALLDLATPRPQAAAAPAPPLVPAPLLPPVPEAPAASVTGPLASPHGGDPH